MAPPTTIQAHHQLRYKPEQHDLFHWIVKTASSLLMTHPSSAVDAILEKPTPKPTCTDIQTLARFIGEHLQPVPDAILKLFAGVIDDRRQTYQDYQKSTAKSTDPLVKHYNCMHRRWVWCLTIAFDSLGGKEWRARQRIPYVTKKDAQQPLFTNRFSALDMDGTNEEGDEGNAGSVVLVNEGEGPKDNDDFFVPTPGQQWTWKAPRKKKRQSPQERMVKSAD
ncbi:hypothetical protein N7486_004552 [Penicillium sp. IBT 16267x]|nr:hypothetical protein N7486_004552 [Penicillium sp. IBT 16267x]